MSSVLKFESANEQATLELGKALAHALAVAFPNATAIVGLTGPLGSGKTRLVQAVALAAGIKPGLVASPTFVLIHEYTGQPPIYHFDAYRLPSEAEFASLGPEEYFSRPGWCFIEWSDRVANCLPADRLEISIEPVDTTTRHFTMRALGSRHTQALAEIRQQLPGR
jgi:tRNA threonylcarbamoyladenosine biosynthesis protein TsaE